MTGRPFRAAFRAPALVLFVWLATTRLPLSGPGFAQTRPALPQLTVNTTYVPPSGQTLAVAAGGDFQAALNAAKPGDVITLAAGATYTGPFTLPNKSGSGWVIVRTSAPDSSLPPPGTRVTPSHAHVMPKLVAAAGSVLTTAQAAHHYRFIGIEIEPTAGHFLYNLVQLGVTETTMSDVPHHIVFDRCYLHGDPAKGTRRGIAMNSRDTAVIDSHLSDFKEVDADSQAIAGWSGPGPFKIVNNYLEAAGENLMFGGARASILGLTPSDIEIRRNYVFKPRAWKQGDPSFQGIAWSVKNLLELKHALRVLIDGNLFDQNWAAAQAGSAIVLTVRGEGVMTWAPVQDVTFQNNIVRNTGHGVTIAGTDSSGPSAGARRMLFSNNLWQINSAQWGGNGMLLLIVQRPDDITFEHNTVDQNGSILFSDLGANPRFVFRNNLLAHGPYGIASDKGVGNPTLTTYFPAVDFRKNAIWGGDSASYSKYPDNFWPPTVRAVGFVDRRGGDYRLAATSRYRHAGTDGKDVGVDFDALSTAMAGNMAPVSGHSLPLSTRR